MTEQTQLPHISTAQRKKALTVVEAALAAAQDLNTPTSSLIEAGIRVARLIGDYVSLTWLELEVQYGDSEQERLDVSWELIQGLGDERARTLRRVAIEHYIEERSLGASAALLIGGEDNTNKVEASTIAGIEAKIRHFSKSIACSSEDSLTAQMRLSQMVLESILSRIRTRVIRYLTREERILGLSNDADALFDQYRAEIDTRLGKICSDALLKFSAACSAFMRQEQESANHALTSCRRFMKAVADKLYPATDEAVKGVDDKYYEMNDEKYVNRLVQWVYEHHPKCKERAVVIDTIHDLHTRLSKLNEVASKGVHTEVESADIRFGLIQTYITMGEVLRFAELFDEMD